MNEPRPESNNDLIQEELVSYLDGELDADSSALVEHRLSEDETYRFQLQQLQKTWDILDHLPRSDVPEAFAKTTVEMVVVRETDESSKKRPPRSFVWIPTIAGFAAAVVIGYLLVSWNVHRTEMQLLADLPIIQNIDMYRYAESIGFLQRLEKERLFVIEVKDEEEGDSEEINVTVAVATPDARQTFLALPAAEKAKLNRQKERFDQTKDDEKSHLRQLHQDLTDDPNSDRLQEVMNEYSSWLSSLSSAERAEHLSKTEDARFEDIRKSVETQQKESFRRKLNLSDDDRRKTYQWFDEFLKRHEDEIKKAFPGELPKHIKDEPEQAKRRLMMYGHLLWMSSRQRMEQNRDPSSKGPPIVFPQPTLEDVDALSDLLSPEGKEILQKLPDNPDFNRTHRLIFVSVACRLKPSEKQRQEVLQKFFLSLPDKRRRELLDLPPEVMRRELRSDFYQRRFRQHHDGKRPRPPREKRGRGKGPRPPFDARRGGPSPRFEKRPGEGGRFPNNSTEKRRGNPQPAPESQPAAESPASL